MDLEISNTFSSCKKTLVIIKLFFVLCFFPVFGSGRRHGKRAVETVQVISTNTRTGSVDMENALRLMPDSVDKSNAPDNIYHGAISVYGKVFDFIGEDGIVIKDAERFFRDNEPIWIDGSFTTTKTEPEFMEWLALQRKHKYTDSSYDLIDNNCLNFVLDAVTYLGGKEPKKLKDQRLFAINNRNNIELLKGLAKAANKHLESAGLGSEVGRFGLR